MPCSRNEQGRNFERVLLILHLTILNLLNKACKQAVVSFAFQTCLEKKQKYLPCNNQILIFFQNSTSASGSHQSERVSALSLHVARVSAPVLGNHQPPKLYCVEGGVAASSVGQKVIKHRGNKDVLKVLQYRQKSQPMHYNHSTTIYTFRFLCLFTHCLTAKGFSTMICPAPIQSETLCFVVLHDLVMRASTFLSFLHSTHFIYSKEN